MKRISYRLPIFGRVVVVALAVLLCGACAGDSEVADTPTGFSLDGTDGTSSASTGTDSGICVPQCNGKECGDDGCGGTCGTCADGSGCLDTGQCICIPTCEDKACGDDGCGNSCGDCGSGEICTNNQCECFPNCQGKDCGDNGCGGTCGSCEPGVACSEDGPCPCIASCEGKACGDDGCGGDCGSCGNGQVCSPDNECCTAQCAGKECGSNGCGGLCGVCPDEVPYCVEGICEPPCQPDCDGKQCGYDGCGGVCGSCDPATPLCVQGQCKEVCTECSVTGTVYFPEGSIPVSGAVVYLSLEMPEPIPDFVYCDKCTQLSFGTPFGVSQADGSFEVIPTAPGTWYLVVEKGAFRRVTTIEIASGGQTLVPASQTTLPKVSNAATGDHIPSIAVVDDSFDNIENTLGKLGLGTVNSSGYLQAGSESFDLFDSTNAPSFFSQWSNLMQYNVVFFPCDSDWFADQLANPAVVQTVRDYVEAGGKLYVTDWSYDIMKAVFPQPITWYDDDGTPNSAQVSPSYDAPATVVDEGLQEWLQVQGITNFDVEDNWTIVEYTSAFEAPDADGDLTMMLPKTWVKAAIPSSSFPGVGTRSSTVSFQYGCGRGLFSTYHTEASFGDSLLPQELALAYIVLEVGICAPTKNTP